MQGKIIVLSAPSGTGKSTIIQKLIKDIELRLGFSISATSRNPRQGETHGKDYYFLTEEEFDTHVSNGDFVEWEEVYAGVKYGTLESEINRVTADGRNLIMDIDVKGALNIKKKYGDKALLIFISPPDLKTLEERLRTRATDKEEVIKKRLDKAEFELGFKDEFDCSVVNDNLDKAVSETSFLIKSFITSV